MTSNTCIGIAIALLSFGLGAFVGGWFTLYRCNAGLREGWLEVNDENELKIKE